MNRRIFISLYLTMSRSFGFDRLMPILLSVLQVSENISCVAFYCSRFLVAKDKEEGKVKKVSKKKKKNINEERQLYKRYRHILPRDLYGSSSSSSTSSSSSEDENQNDTKEYNTSALPENQISDNYNPEQLPPTKADNRTAIKGNDGEEDSRLPTILSSDNENSGSENESGYGSRLRSQEEQFRNSPHLTSEMRGQFKTNSYYLCVTVF